MRLMKRTPTKAAVTLLVLICLSISAAWAEYVPARILLGAREAPIAPSPVFDGQRVLAPLSVLRSLGASHITSPDSKQVTIIPASGESADIETILVNETPMIPMDAVIRIIGGTAKWDDEKRTLMLLATLGPVEFVDNKLKINCSFPVAYTADDWGGRIWVDAHGAIVESEAREVFIGGAVVERARLGQFNPTTVRVTLDLNTASGYRFETTSPSAQIVLSVGKDVPAQIKPGTQKPKPYKGEPFTIEQLSVQTIDDERFTVVLATSNRGKAALDYGVMPPQIVLKLPGASLADDFATATGEHALLKSIGVGELCTDGSGVRVEINLARIMAYDIREDDTAITLNVRTPDSSGGALRDKLIVIDPGHGGHDKGAHLNCGGILEKDIDLTIANELAVALQKAGARTILTRGEEYIKLAERP